MGGKRTRRGFLSKWGSPYEVGLHITVLLAIAKVAGLDHRIIDAIDHESVSERVKIDIRSDFILAPHFNAIFISAHADLWSRLSKSLRAGTYNPDLPLTISVPKERWFTRPGSILQPFDRLLYQALIDGVADTLEQGMDRARSFSHVLSDEPNQMFAPAHECWEQFQSKITQICNLGTHVLRADIANYFERIPQHHLINLMSAAGCPPEIVKLLEEMLLAFQERDSFGIVQGLFPSDILGNFFLSHFDAFCELHDLPSARYADDIYLAFDSESAARQGLFQLIEGLRKDGLHLNEYKSDIFPATEIIREETAIDRLFQTVRDNVDDELHPGTMSPYAFEADWEFEDDEPDDAAHEEEIDALAAERLFGQIDEYPKYADRIEKFCLPLLRRGDSDVAVDYVLEHLHRKPHQIRLYFSYLASFVRDNPALVKTLEQHLESDELISGYQMMFLLATLIRAPQTDRRTVNRAIHWLQNRQVAKEVRAMAAIYASRHGNPNQKRAVRLEYENEPSDYVRSAILYAARYFTNVEKRTCKRAWGGHNEVNALIANTI